MGLDVLTNGPLPAVAILIIVDDHPVSELSLILEVPSQGAFALESMVGGANVLLKRINSNSCEIANLTLLQSVGLTIKSLSLNLTRLHIGCLGIDNLVACGSTECNQGSNQKY